MVQYFDMFKHFRVRKHKEKALKWRMKNILLFFWSWNRKWWGFKNTQTRTNAWHRSLMLSENAHGIFRRQNQLKYLSVFGYIKTIKSDFSITTEPILIVYMRSCEIRQFPKTFWGSGDCLGSSQMIFCGLLHFTTNIYLNVFDDE